MRDLALGRSSCGTDSAHKSQNRCHVSMLLQVHDRRSLRSSGIVLSVALQGSPLGHIYRLMAWSWALNSQPATQKAGRDTIKVGQNSDPPSCCTCLQPMPILSPSLLPCRPCEVKGQEQASSRYATADFFLSQGSSEMECAWMLQQACVPKVCMRRNRPLYMRGNRSEGRIREVSRAGKYNWHFTNGENPNSPPCCCARERCGQIGLNLGSKIPCKISRP